MARPHKQTVDYFPHDANASDGTTLTILESKFGNDGFAFWFKLLERLCASDGHVMDCRNAARWQFLLAKTHLDEDTAISLLDTLAELQAIDQELWGGKIIWSQNLVNNLADVYRNRRSPLPQKPIFNGHNPSNDIVSTLNNPHSAEVSTSKSTQSIVKESIVKESNILLVWNQQNIICHKHLTDDTKRAITTALKQYTEDEIITAIKNYSEIQKGEQYFFKYAWTLKDFLKRGLEKFLNIEVAKRNYISNSKTIVAGVTMQKNDYENMVVHNAE